MSRSGTLGHLKYPRDFCHSERGRSFVCSDSRHWYLVYEVEAWQPAIDAKHDRSKARIRQRCHHTLPPDTEDTTMDVPTLTVALIAEKPLEDAHDRRWWRWPERPVQSFDSLSTTKLVPPISIDIHLHFEPVSRGCRRGGGMEVSIRIRYSIYIRCILIQATQSVRRGMPCMDPC